MAVRFQKLRVGILDHIDDGRLCGVDLAVFTFLLLRCKVQGDRGVVWTSYPVLVDALSFSEKQVRCSFQRLEKHRYIRVFRQQGSRGKYPVLIHRYELTDQGRREVYIDAWETTDYECPLTYQGTDREGGREGDREGERVPPYSESIEKRPETKSSSSGSFLASEKSPSIVLPTDVGDTQKKPRKRRAKADPAIDGAERPESTAPNSEASATSAIPEPPGIPGKDGRNLTPKDVLTAWDARWKRARGSAYVRTAARKEATLAAGILSAGAKTGLVAEGIGAAMDRFFEDPFWSGGDFSSFASKFASFTSDRAPDPKRARFTKNDPLLSYPDGRRRSNRFTPSVPPRSVPEDVRLIDSGDGRRVRIGHSEGLPESPLDSGGGPDGSRSGEMAERGDVLREARADAE